MEKTIKGFSKLSKRKKLQWIVENFFRDPEKVMKELMSYWLLDEEKQKLLDRFSENTISNFHLPFGVAPNFLINGQSYCVPMVIEESSVVAAASNAAKYWMERGGFHAEVLCTSKVGQVHFKWMGDIQILQDHFEDLKRQLLEDASSITKNMKERGGGVTNIELLDLSESVDDCYQLKVSFETIDSMGANFINSVLESFAQTLVDYVSNHQAFGAHRDDVEILMSILSNYSPGCLVRAWVECPVDDLGTFGNYSAYELAKRFETAIKIAKEDPYRATTHNKGIFNGIDAVVLATANDFRAVEANGHAYASRDGQYRSLSDCEVTDEGFKFWLEMPMAIGTVGGLTALHPMAKHALELLGHPSSRELMQIIACMGLAQNFAAVRSLVTTGIQKGHMKMHLNNVLASLNASEIEAREAIIHFKDQVISYSAVRDFLQILRGQTVKSS